MDQRELDALPGTIEALESEQASLEQKISDPAFYQQGQEQVQAALQEMTEISRKLEAAYLRWEELDA